MSFSVNESPFLRSSFLIDEDGCISHAWYAVKPEDTVSNAIVALKD
jgi:peroxiredoxin